MWGNLVGLFEDCFDHLFMRIDEVFLAGRERVEIVNGGLMCHVNMFGIKAIGEGYMYIYIYVWVDFGYTYGWNCL